MGLWGVLGMRGLSETPAPLSVPLEPPQFGISKRKLAQSKGEQSWIYSQVNMSQRLTESPFPGENARSSLKFAFAYKEGNKFFACLQHWHFITIFSICLSQ